MIEETITAFETLTVLETDETCERFIFNGRRQKEGELFLLTLQELITTFSYHEACTVSVLPYSVILDIRDSTVQEALLKEGGSMKKYFRHLFGL